MTALQMRSSLNNQVANLEVMGTNPVTFFPIVAKWAGCNTSQEAAECGSVLAVGVATAILRVLQNPVGLAPQVASARQAITTGGFVVDINLNMQSLSATVVQVMLPMAQSDIDARKQAYTELLQIVKDTVDFYWEDFVRRIDDPNFSSWPSWAQAIRREWVY